MENREVKKMKMTTTGEGEIDPDGDIVMSPVPEKDLLIYFCTLAAEDQMNWYALNPNTGTCNIIKEISSVSVCKYGTAIFNSKIYFVGGKKTGIGESPINNVQVYEPSTKELHTVDSLHCARALPVVVPVQGFRLYVFGGQPIYDIVKKNTVCQPWGEYYDGEKWHKLPTDPPPQITRIRSFIGRAVYGGDSIILWSEVLCCLYNITQSSWCFLEFPYDPQFHGQFLCYSENVAVVDDTLYWCFGNLFAFHLDKTDNTVDNPVYKFERSDSLTTAPSFSSCMDALLPHSVFRTGKERLCVVWFDHVSNENDITVSWENFQIRKQSCDTGESTDVRVFPMGGLHTTKVDGYNVIQFPGVLKHNDVQGNHDFKWDDEKPSILDPLNLLVNLSQTMFINNYNSLEQSIKGCTFAATVNGQVYVIDPSPVELYKPQAQIELPDFLEQINLSKYLQIFGQENINMVGLMYFTDVDFNALNIPLGDRNKIVRALRDVEFA